MRRIFLWLIYRVIMRFMLKLFAGISIKNKENLIHKGPSIIVANHNSHLDTITIMSFLPTKQLIKTHPVAAGDYFGKSNRKVRLSNYFINALLIPRGRPKEGENKPDPIAMMLEILDRGHSLILFPEGSRGEPEVMQEFKWGIGLLLEVRPEIPFIPIHLKGLGKVLPKGDPVPVPHLSTISCGKPNYANSKDPAQIVAQVHDCIISLKNN